MKSLLMMAPFWDPYCPPLGICSLQAAMKHRGRDVAIFDFNTDPQIWRAHRAYFDALVEVVPDARRWNILRLGPDYFARHQMAWLRLRDEPRRYRELSCLILDINGRQRIDPARLQRFDAIFEDIYRRVDTLLDEQLSRHRPTLVGCTMLTTTLPASLHILRRAKELNPEVRTVLGGPGPIMGAGADSPDTLRILESCPWLDNIVIGEGELLIDALHQDRVQRRKMLSLRDVPAVVAESGQEITLRKGLIKDISSLPPPDYAGLDVQNYSKLSLGITRGCAYQCSFCYETTYWKQYRKRPIEGALDDMQVLRERHDKKNFFLCDSLSNLFARDLASGLQSRGMDVKWDAYLRADAPLLDQAYCEHLARGGMVRARIGVESADDATLELMDKRTDASIMGQVIDNLARAGIETTTLWIVGFPNEDETAFQHSLDFLREHSDSIFAADPWQFIFHPTTGAEPVFGRLVAADSFEAQYGMRRLYPEEFDSTLLVQYHELDIPDVVALKVDRLERMVACIESCGIPNPYSLADWRAARGRWRALHPTRAVPA